MRAPIFSRAIGERYGRLALLVVLACFGLPLVALPSRLGAQLAPDSPRLISPHGSGGLGLHWLRGGTLPGDDESIIATWAMPGLPGGMRLRGGAGRGASARNSAFGGLDYQAALLRGDPELPFDLDWQVGLGVGVGDYVLVSLPIGLSGGVSWRSESFWMSPYLTAGMAADIRVGDEAPERRFEVSPALDVGLDVAFDAERRVVIRTSASLGDRQAVSVGLAFGLGRP